MNNPKGDGQARDIRVQIAADSKCFIYFSGLRKMNGGKSFVMMSFWSYSNVLEGERSS
jgi:hypothetical protein